MSVSGTTEMLSAPIPRCHAAVSRFPCPPARRGTVSDEICSVRVRDGRVPDVAVRVPQSVAVVDQPARSRRSLSRPPWTTVVRPRVQSVACDVVPAGMHLR